MVAINNKAHLDAWLRVQHAEAYSFRTIAAIRISSDVKFSSKAPTVLITRGSFLDASKHDLFSHHYDKKTISRYQIRIEDVGLVDGLFEITSFKILYLEARTFEAVLTSTEKPNFIQLKRTRL